jgi:hypothetical protein
MPSATLMPVMSIQQAAERHNMLVEYTKSVMVKDQDFGVIPGVSKPCLYKAGAEKLLSLFGFSPSFSLIERVEDWTGKDHGAEPFFYYFYKCQLLRGGEILGEGDGSCNSWEKKYRYRNGDRKCPQCGKPTIIVGKQEYGGGFICFAKKGGCGAKFGSKDPSITGQDTGQVPNPDIAEQVNTLQKMAQKRALVAAVLIACNASAFYTQDVEDMQTIDVTPTETRDEVVERRLAEERAKAPAKDEGGYVLTELGEKVHAAITTPAATIMELADSLDQTPEPPLMAPDVKKPPKSSAYEMREAAKREEVEQVLKPVGTPKETRKRGAISFTALKQWGEIKKEILKLTGTTDLYYEALKAGGYAHADEIKTQDDAAKIWKALKAITAELGAQKQDKALLLELETQTQRIGQNAMDYALQAHGLRSIKDVLALDGEPFQAFMDEVRGIVGWIG